MTLNQQVTDKDLAKKQTTLLAKQYGQINTIKKKDNINKDKKKSKKDKTPIINPITKNPKEKVTNHKPICYKCNKPGHYQNNCVSKIKTSDLHSEINLLKQEIKEIKTSSFQITEEQLVQEMVTLKINNNC